VSAGWIDASVVLSTTHAAEFEAVIEEALEPCGATAIPYPFLRVRLRNSDDEVVLLMALSSNRCGQHHRVAPLCYAFPTEWEEEVRDILAFHSIKAGVVPSVCYRLELRRAAMLDDLRGALLARTPTFGPTYPRIAA
jgi:hypothetical protein